jgi:hypothetical protein
VHDSIKSMDPSRRAYQLINSVLVETTVGEAIPKIEANKDGVRESESERGGREGIRDVAGRTARAGVCVEWGKAACVPPSPSPFPPPTSHAQLASVVANMQARLDELSKEIQTYQVRLLLAQWRSSGAPALAELLTCLTLLLNPPHHSPPPSFAD